MVYHSECNPRTCENRQRSVIVLPAHWGRTFTGESHGLRGIFTDLFHRDLERNTIVLAVS